MGNNYTKDITIHHHDILLQALRTRESDYIKFLGIIITALASFGYTLEKYLNSLCNQYLILFIAGTFLSLFLFIWGIGLSVIYGYNFRQLQIVLYKMADNLEATTEKNNKLGYLPTIWNPCDKIHDDEIKLPGLYKYHNRIFWLFTIGIIIISFIVMIDKVIYFVIMIFSICSITWIFKFHKQIFFGNYWKDKLKKTCISCGYMKKRKKKTTMN